MSAVRSRSGPPFDYSCAALLQSNVPRPIEGLTASSTPTRSWRAISDAQKSNKKPKPAQGRFLKFISSRCFKSSLISIPSFLSSAKSIKIFHQKSLFVLLVPPKLPGEGEFSLFRPFMPFNTNVASEALVAPGASAAQPTDLDKTPPLT